MCLQADVEDYLLSVGVQTVKWYQEAEKVSKPYVTRWVSVVCGVFHQLVIILSFCQRHGKW